MQTSNTITITYGDQAEAHVGMKKNGRMAEAGLTIEEIDSAAQKFSDQGGSVVNYNLKDLLDSCEIEAVKALLPHTEEAKFLVVSNGVDTILSTYTETGLGHQDMYKEQNDLKHDRHYWDTRRKKKLNKNARGNLCFDHQGSEADFEGAHAGTIVAFNDVPVTNAIRLMLPNYFGSKGENLKAEGNYYYDSSKTGIGFHGDAERKITIGTRLGNDMPMCYQWFYRGKAIGKKLEITMPSGTIYAMSQKAAGCDWKRSSILTLRHAAGSPGYTTIAESRKWGEEDTKKWG